MLEEYGSIQRADLNDMHHMIESTGLSVEASNVRQMYEILLQDETASDGKVSTQQMIECLDILYEEYVSRHRIYTVKHILELLQEILVRLFGEKSSVYLADVHRFLETVRKEDWLYLCDTVSSVLGFREVVNKQDLDEVITRYEEQCIFNADDIFINNQDPVDLFVCNVSLFLDDIVADRIAEDINEKARYLREESAKLKEHIDGIRCDMNDRLFGVQRRCEDLAAENASLRTEVESVLESQGGGQFSRSNSKELRFGSQSRLAQTRDLNLIDENLKLQDVIESLKAENKALRSTADSLRSDKSQLERDSEKLREMVEDLNKKCTELMDEHVALQTGLASANSRLQGFEEFDGEKARLVQQNQSLRQQAEEQAQRAEYLESEVSNLVLAVNQLRGNVEQPHLITDSSVNVSNMSFEEFAEPRREFEVAIELSTYWFKIADIPLRRRRGVVTVNKLLLLHRAVEKPVVLATVTASPQPANPPATQPPKPPTKATGTQTTREFARPLINSIFEVDLATPLATWTPASSESKQQQTEDFRPQLSTSQRVIGYCYKGTDQSLMVKTYQDMNIKLQREKEDLELRFRQYYNKTNSKQLQEQHQSSSHLDSLRATIEALKKELSKLQQEYQQYRESKAGLSQEELVRKAHQEKLKQQLKAAQAEAMMMSFELETFKQSVPVAQPQPTKRDQCISTELMIIPQISEKQLENSLAEGAKKQLEKKDTKQSMDQIRSCA